MTADDPEGRRVYVIEVLPKWYYVAEKLDDQPINEGRCVFYVGQTGHSPGKRHKKHRTGKRAGRIFKRIRREIEKTGVEDLTLKKSVDTRLRQDLAAGIPDGLSNERALEEEAALAEKLRAAGHTVFSN
jgi:hypothetical protein